MSFDAFLNQICIITRARETGTNAYNNTTTVPDTVGNNVRCRKTQRTMRMMDQSTSEYAVVHADLILFPAGTDVQPKDKVTIGSQVWQVTQVLSRFGMSEQRHVSTIVEAVNVR